MNTFHGHTGSVKTLAFSRTDPTCFATGGRDGKIKIWDTRGISARNSVNEAHSFRGNIRSVTGVSFQVFTMRLGFHLISCN